MPRGSITQYIDVAQLVLYAFWIFFAALILYLRREDKREGYPLESDRSQHVAVQGYPAIPAPKTYVLPHGGTVVAPRGVADTRPVRAVPVGPWPGAPLEPTGDAMVDGVGPGAWAERADEPDRTVEGADRIVPMRVASDFWIEQSSPDPRGMNVVGADGRVAGTVRDLWVDRSEPQVRYLEVEVPDGAARRNVLLPITLAVVDPPRRRVRVASILASQFAAAPVPSKPDQVTLLEEDRISAFFASGHLYAVPGRQEPLV